MINDLKQVAFIVMLCVFSLVANGCSSSSGPPVPEGSDLDDAPDQAYFTVELISDSSRTFSRALLLYRLYGYNSRVADADAVVLQEDVSTISEVPVQVDLHWPDGAAEMIQPSLGQTKDARYYYSLSVDSNADRVICEGDLVQDYELTPFTVLEGKPADKQDYFMKERDAGSGACVYFN